MFISLILILSLVPPGGSATEEILHVLEAQASAWNSGDIVGYMNGYWKSDSLLFTSGGTVSRGWNATLEKYSTKYNSKEKMGNLVFSDLEVFTLSPHAAWVLGRWELIRATDHPHGIFTLVFRRLPEGWRVVHDHTSLENER